jgi:hypothetical protein
MVICSEPRPRRNRCNGDETMSGLLELAERVEKATGPDAEMDMLIWAALNGVTEIRDTESKRVEGRDITDGQWLLLGWIDPGKHSRNFSPYGGDKAYPNVTASLDAAITLVPDGWRWSVDSVGVAAASKEGQQITSPSPLWEKAAVNPALALCAAALRALAHQTAEERDAPR